MQRLALLKPGSQFAEFSVLAGSTKSGSAYAYENSVLLRLSGAHFMEILRRFPAVSAKLALDIAELNEEVQSSNDFIPFYRASDLKIPRAVADAPIASPSSASRLLRSPSCDGNLAQYAANAQSSRGESKR